MLLSITRPDTPEKIVGTLAICGLIAAAIYGFCQWVLASPRNPDPWGDDIEREVEEGETVPLCPHCLAPQAHNGWFCPECGSTAAGQYGHYLPGVYIFSFGEVLRAGVEWPGRWTLLVATGSALAAFYPLSGLALIYWLFLLAHRSRITRQRQEARTEASA